MFVNLKNDGNLLSGVICSSRLLRRGKAARSNPNLVGDHHLVPKGGQKLTNKLFIGERAVDLGGVGEGDAAFDGRSDY